MNGRPPIWARLLLWLRPLGSRRAEVVADLEELFAMRVAATGLADARRRFTADVVSLWVRRAPASATREPARRAGFLTGWWSDLVHASRLFHRHRGLVATAIGGLAIGIGISTSVFSVANATLLRPIGVENPAATVRVMRTTTSPSGSGVSTGWSYSQFLALRRDAATATIEASLGEGASLRLDAGAAPGRAVPITFMTGTSLATFGGKPHLGRLLTADDDRPGAAVVAVASYGFWANALGADPSVIGKPIWLSGTRVTLVGVTQRGFTGPMMADVPPAVWLTFAANETIFHRQHFVEGSNAIVNVVARINDGVPVAQAQGQLSAVATRSAEPSWSGGSHTSGVRLDPTVVRFDGPDGNRMLVALTVVVIVIGLLLLLACVNVANLLLAGAAARQAEIGVRLALGASRARVIRQLLTESLVLAVVAGTAGWIFSLWGMPLLRVLVRAPETLDLVPDVRVYVFLTAVSLLAGVLAGLAPARYGTRGDLVAPLKGAGEHSAGTRTSARQTLVGVQAAASMLLLVMAALFARGLWHASRIDLGFDASRLLSVSVNLSASGQPSAALESRWNDVLNRVRALPGVDGASLGLFTPFGDGYGVGVTTLKGGRYTVYTNATRADYFQVAGLRLMRGRFYTEAEVRTGAEVAVVSQTLARDVWGDADPIGQTLDPLNFGSDRVIGVVADAVTADLIRHGTAALYSPLAPAKLATARMIVRTAGESADLVRPVSAAVNAAAADAEAVATPVLDGFAKQLEGPRILAGAAALLGGLALALALVGLHGVTAFVLHQRTREIGVRMAIGASARDIARLLARDSLRPVLIGLSIGLALALLGGQVLAAVLYGLSARDPIAIAGALIILLAGASAAIITPVRRASRVDPARVLR